MLDYLPVGVMIVKKNNTLKYINKEMRSIVTPEYDSEAQEPKERQEKELHSFECMAEQAEPHTSLKEALISTQEMGEKVYRMGLEGRSFEVKTKCLPVVSGKTCKIAVIKDQTLYEALVKEKALEKYQRMLLSSISHEIRNPLNAIEGYLTFIKEAKGGLEGYCLKLRSAAHQIGFIVDGACDLLMSENKTLILQPRKFNVKEAVSGVVEILAPNIEAKNLPLLLNMPENLPPLISSDPKRYKLILFQLLANALKYTNKGEITVNCSYDEIENILITKVKDTGLGISSEALPKLFKLYTNIEKANTYNPQGMGLGLALCEKLARILGGDIKCESTVGEGSIFTFAIKNYVGNAISDPDIKIPLPGPVGEEIRNLRLFFPRHITELSPSLSYRSDTTEIRTLCSCRQVLIVDDEPTNRVVVKHYLMSVGLAADEASNGLEGYNIVEERAKEICCSRYKLIIMDINMPIMDGTEATMNLVKLFSSKPKAKAPIVAVTAANMQNLSDIQNLLSVGFADIRNVSV